MQTLTKYLEANPNLSEEEKLSLSIAILQAIKDYHKKTHKAHLNIAPENIMINTSATGINITLNNPLECPVINNTTRLKWQKKRYYSTPELFENKAVKGKTIYKIDNYLAGLILCDIWQFQFLTNDDKVLKALDKDLVKFSKNISKRISEIEALKTSKQLSNVEISNCHQKLNEATYPYIDAKKQFVNAYKKYNTCPTFLSKRNSSMPNPSYQENELELKVKKIIKHLTYLEPHKRRTLRKTIELLSSLNAKDITDNYDSSSSLDSPCSSSSSASSLSPKS